MREIKFRQLTEILQRVGVENQSDQYLTLVGGSFVPKADVDACSVEWLQSNLQRPHDCRCESRVIYVLP